MSATRPSELSVCLGDQCVPVGTLRFGRVRAKQVSHFRYQPSWLESPSAFAIDPALPLDSRVFSFSGSPGDLSACFPGAICDASPDAWGREIIEHASRRRLDELDYLVAVDDRTRMGALRFLDGDGTPLAHEIPPVPRVVELGRLHNLCSDLLSGSGNLREIATELRGASTSMGGARPKAVVSSEDGTLYLAKFTTSLDSRPVENVEVATLALALEVGVRASRATLAKPGDGKAVALIKRFDRGPGGAGRVHYLSARSFIEARRGEPHYYTDIADRLRAGCRTGTRARGELHELHRRVLFSILVSNTDDHLRNHGLLYDSTDGWILSPAFDINPQPHRHPRMKTGISESSGFEPSVEAWIEVAPLFDVSEDKARETALAMGTTISHRWRQLLLKHGLSERQCSFYADAFEHDRMAAALARSRAFTAGRWRPRAPAPPARGGSTP